MKLFLSLLLVGIASGSNAQMNSIDMTDEKEIAILANGCFWCTEAIFQQLQGVDSVEPGYIGGTKDNPTYEEVCTGNTFHAEALRIVFDPKIITYEQLLEVYFATHDPTTLNRQGNDIGTQYRSEIFFTNSKQKELAENFIRWMTDEKIFDNPIVTKISPATIFWVAEDYHHNYYKTHPDKTYCAMVIHPKVEKFKKYFQDRLKK